MIGIRTLLLSAASISALGVVATGGYFLFKPETPDQNLRTGGASDRSGGLRDTQADTAEAQSLSSSSTVTPSQGSGAAADSSTQLPSR